MTAPKPPVARVGHGELETLASAILRAEGLQAEAAAIVAHSLVLADLRGQASHGLGRLHTYVKRMRAGLTTTVVQPALVSETAAFRVYDGGAGFGHVIGLRVMEACVERARSTGLAAASVRNSTHFGIAATFALAAADAGMIGLAASNGAARMPPVGSRTPVLGTNPLAVAVPRRGAEPILLDMATSATAVGKILVAIDRSEPIPEGWALNGSGRPTTDPKEALGGLMLPMAGPKGFGLALVLEILSACLSGAPPGRGAGSVMNTWDRPEGLGHFFLAISPESIGVSDFSSSVEDLVGQVHGAEPIAGGRRPLLPGELEAHAEKEARALGVALAGSTRGALRELASRHQIACDL